MVGRPHRKRRRNPAASADPAPLFDLDLDLGVVEEVQGLCWRARLGRVVLATGFADRADAEAWLSLQSNNSSM